MAWHISYRSPCGMLFSSRQQTPLSQQLSAFLGEPLYPVDTITPFFTITAPYWRRMQVERLATASAIPRKYSSLVGLFISITPFSGQAFDGVVNQLIQFVFQFAFFQSFLYSLVTLSAKGFVPFAFSVTVKGSIRTIPFTTRKLDTRKIKVLIHVFTCAFGQRPQLVNS
jgi:hypothetical protein